MTRRVSVSLPDELVRLLDEISDETGVSRSRLVANLVEGRILSESIPISERKIPEDRLDEIRERTLESVPDPTVKLARREREDRRIRDEQTLRERRISWDDRVLGFFKSRLEGDAAYPPDGMGELAQGYVADAVAWGEDDDEIDRKRKQARDWLETYRVGYEAREFAESPESEISPDDVSGWFDVGAGIRRLRENQERAREIVLDAVESDGSDLSPDAVADRLSDELDVPCGSAWLFVEMSVGATRGPDESIRDVLVFGSGPDSDRIRRALGSGDDDRDPLPEGAEVRLDRATREDGEVREISGPGRDQ